jgi:hypothetical protein
VSQLADAFKRMDAYNARHLQEQASSLVEELLASANINFPHYGSQSEEVLSQLGVLRNIDMAKIKHQLIENKVKIKQKILNIKRTAAPYRDAPAIPEEHNPIPIPAYSMDAYYRLKGKLREFPLKTRLTKRTATPPEVAKDPFPSVAQQPEYATEELMLPALEPLLAAIVSPPLLKSAATASGPAAYTAPTYRVLQARSNSSSQSLEKRLDETAATPRSIFADDNINTKISDVKVIADSEIDRVIRVQQRRHECTSNLLIRATVCTVIDDLISDIDERFKTLTTENGTSDEVENHSYSTSNSTDAVSDFTDVIQGILEFTAVDELICSTVDANCVGNRDTGNLVTTIPLAGERARVEAGTAELPSVIEGDNVDDVLAREEDFPHRSTCTVSPGRFRTSFGRVFMNQISERPTAPNYFSGSLLPAESAQSVNDRRIHRTIPTSTASILEQMESCSRTTADSQHPVVEAGSPEQSQDMQSVANIVAAAIMRYAGRSRNHVTPEDGARASTTRDHRQSPRRLFADQRVDDLLKRTVEEAVRQTTHEVRMKLQHEYCLQRQSPQKALNMKSGDSRKELVTYHDNVNVIYTENINTFPVMTPASRSNARKLIDDDVFYSTRNLQLLSNRRLPAGKSLYTRRQDELSSSTECSTGSGRISENSHMNSSRSAISKNSNVTSGSSTSSSSTSSSHSRISANRVSRSGCSSTASSTVTSIRDGGSQGRLRNPSPQNSLYSGSRSSRSITSSASLRSSCSYSSSYRSVNSSVSSSGGSR